MGSLIYRQVPHCEFTQNNTKQKKKTLSNFQMWTQDGQEQKHDLSQMLLEHEWSSCNDTNDSYRSWSHLVLWLRCLAKALNVAGRMGKQSTTHVHKRIYSQNSCCTAGLCMTHVTVWSESFHTVTGKFTLTPSNHATHLHDLAGQCSHNQLWLAWQLSNLKRSTTWMTLYLRWDWISTSLLSWCSTPAFSSCFLKSTFRAKMNLLCRSLAR